MVVAFDILFLLPVFILGGILLLFGVIVLLGRWRGGKYLKPLLMQLQKIPFMERWMQRARVPPSRSRTQSWRARSRRSSGRER